MHECVGTRAYDDALPLEQPQVLGRHVLVVEGQDVAALREPAQGLQVALVAHLDVRHDLRGTVGGLPGQHAQPDAQPDRRRSHHPSQLSTSDDADDGEAHVFKPIHRPTRRCVRTSVRYFRDHFGHNGPR